MMIMKTDHQTRLSTAFLGEMPEHEWKVEYQPPLVVRPLRNVESRPRLLTDRQESVAHLLAMGLTNKEISCELGIHVQTVKRTRFPCDAKGRTEARRR